MAATTTLDFDADQSTKLLSMENLKEVKSFPPAPEGPGLSERSIFRAAEDAMSSMDDLCSTHASNSDIGRDDIFEADKLEESDDLFQRIVSDRVQDKVPLQSLVHKASSQEEREAKAANWGMEFEFASDAQSNSIFYKHSAQCELFQVAETNAEQCGVVSKGDRSCERSRVDAIESRAELPVEHEGINFVALQKRAPTDVCPDRVPHEEQAAVKSAQEPIAADLREPPVDAVSRPAVVGGPAASQGEWLPLGEATEPCTQAPAPSQEKFQVGADRMQQKPAQAIKETIEKVLAPLKPLPLQRRCKIQPPAASKLGKGLRVAFVVNGSTGDVQPLLALSLQLMLFNHNVCFFTSANMVSLCEETGVRSVPVFADTHAVIHSLGGVGSIMLRSMTDCAKVAKAWLTENNGACISVEDALREFEPDAVVVGPQAAGAAFQYEADTGVPVMHVHFSYEGFLLWQAYADMKPLRPLILPVNPHVRVGTWELPTHVHHVGEFVLYNVPSERDLATGGKFGELRRFLGTGPPPVAVGWGSMLAQGMKPLEMLALALRTLKRAEMRGVILGGWAELDKLASELADGKIEGFGEDLAEMSAFAAKEVCFVDSAPHEWLFPQCCTVVHHGGAGTFQSAIRAGKPSVITPIFGDQFHHAITLEKLKAGVGFRKSLPQIEPAELCSAIKRSESKTAAAEALSKKMRSQVGERDAAEIIDSFLREQVQTGNWGKAESLSGKLHPKLTQAAKPAKCK